MLDQQEVAEALDLHRRGLFREAAGKYHLLLSLDSGNARLWALHGIVRGELGELDTAVRYLHKAIKLQPGNPDFYMDLAATYGRQGNTAKMAGTYLELGNRLMSHGQYEPAIAIYDKALAVQPDHTHAMSNRGVACNELKRFDEAIVWFDRALAREPELLAVIVNRGVAMAGQRKFAEAIDAYRAAIEIQPSHPSPYINLGQALSAVGENEQAIAAYRTALEYDPALAAAHWNLSHLLLLQGDYAEGWKEYEWRWQWTGFKEPRRTYAQPLWRGEPASEIGGPLLLASEQGFGDVIQFARYAPVLAAQGYGILLEVPPLLYRLFDEGFSKAGITIIRREGATHELAGAHPFAAWVPLLSLPERLGTMMETIPATVPYLSVPPELVAQWRSRLAAPPGKRAVGIVWAGRPDHALDHERSLPFTALTPLQARDDIALYALQTGHAALAGVGAPGLISLGDKIDDFADTAAIMSTMDVVITVDTASAHLAGALGLPVWVLVTTTPDWRWPGTGATSPWYPTARLFRQTQKGDWDSVIAAVGAALDEIMCGK